MQRQRHPDDSAGNHPLEEPTWVSGLAERLRDRLDAANETESLITAEDARTIAICLRSYLGPRAGRALSDYASRKQLDAFGVRAECITARRRGLPPQLARWTAWLAVYAAYALPPALGPSPIPTNGDALDAFLSLPDSDDDNAAVLDNFTLAYCGSYTDPDALLDGLTDIDTWEREIKRTADKFGIHEFVSIDRAAMIARLAEQWTILPRHRQLHAFAR